MASAAALFVILTFVQARSWIITGTFLGALSASILIIGGLGLGMLKLATKWRAKAVSPLPHLATAIWTRRLGTSLLLIMVSALAGLLSQLLPHLEKTLVGELRSGDKTERPGLFMVDIQDEQVDPVKKFLADNGVEVSRASPFIRARILSVNGSDFERKQTGRWSTREEENDARFRNRGVNLSYREELSTSEKIISGKEWKDLKEKGKVY